MSEPDKTFWEGCHVVGGCNALHRENDRLGACESAFADAIERKDAVIAELEAHLAASDERVEFLRASFDTAMALLRGAQKMVSDYQSRS